MEKLTPMSSLMANTLMKRMLRFVAYAIAALAIICGVLVLYLIEPHIAVSEVRITDRVESIRGEYGIACEAIYMFGYQGEQSLGKLSLVLPDGGMDPTTSEAAVPGNSFEFTGYRYKTIRRNRFTNAVAEIPSGRLDVVEWHAITPYNIYPFDEQGNYAQSNTPLGWKSRDDQSLFAAHVEFAHRGC
jgi:hypothetical protein